jgi:succinate dehydrogenase / fumarate reductase, membrane anchor subunit
MTMASNPSSLRTPLSKVRGLGSAKSGTEHFWLQRVTAVANVVLAIAFVAIVIQLVGKDYAAARAIVAKPVNAILLLLFVVSGTIHMRLGMQVIIEDYVHGEGAKVALVMLNTFFAIAMAVASIFAILKLAFGG